MFKNAFKTCGMRCGISLAFGKYLLLTNTLTSGVIMMIGDALQQHHEAHHKMEDRKLDYKRSTYMFAAGVSMGPLNHFFYDWLDKRFPERSLQTTAKKIMLDLFMLSPPCIFIFFCVTGFFESKTLNAIMEEVKQKFLYVFVIDCFVMCPAQIINFYYVPVKYQVIYVNSSAIIYGMLLSYLKHHDK